MKILLFGGSGTLGTELQQLDKTLICPPKGEVNIRYIDEVRTCIKHHSPDIVIHSAASISNIDIEKNPEIGIETNIIGTSNVSIVCAQNDIRLVYISTDYVYNGKTGNYTETSPIDPTNIYAWTKLGGECAVKCVSNHLIIRTSFGTTTFPYTVAYDNQYTSKDYVDVIAPMILNAVNSKTIGVLNIGTDRKSMYEYATERNDAILKKNTNFKDHSLNTKKYYEIK